MSITAVAKCDEAYFALQGALSLKAFVDLRFLKEVLVLFWGRLHGDQGAGDDVESLVDFTHPASANPVLQDVRMASQGWDSGPQRNFTFQQQPALWERDEGDCQARVADPCLKAFPLLTTIEMDYYL